MKSLQGIGEMTALRVLSFMTPSELIDSVKREDRTKLEKIPKVKGKTSEKILFEVKQNLKKFESFLEDSIPAGTPKDDKVNLAVMALVQLGYDERTALKEVKKQIEKSPSSDAADIIRDVLKYS